MKTCSKCHTSFLESNFRKSKKYKDNRPMHFTPVTAAAGIAWPNSWHHGLWSHESSA